MTPAHATLAYLAVGALVAVVVYRDMNRVARDAEAGETEEAEDVDVQVRPIRGAVGDAWLPVPVLLLVTALVWPVLVVWAVAGRFRRE